MKVAAYCRVSTDKSDQINSYTNQIHYFEELAASNTEWELYNIYADEGISGTSTFRRAEFNKMISDAYDGKFDLIVTKEVSRFSRNILDTITYTRELKRLGVGVLFLTDGINTMDADSELRLSIMGSIAQEESRKTSSRVKWGQTRQMERGVVFGGSLIGYTVENGIITVEPIGAELVRNVYTKYVIENKGTTAIAREMEILSKQYGVSRKWTPAYIAKILKNEKYAGDLLQKKTFTPDYLTHAKKYNRGEEEKIYIKDHHEPIVDRETWETAQKLIERRNKQKDSTSCSVRYAFSGRVKCGVCGKTFVSRNRVGNIGKYKTWVCSGTLSGEKCSVGTSVRDAELYSMVQTIMSIADINREKLEKTIVSAVFRLAKNKEQRNDIQRTVRQLLRGELTDEALVRQIVDSIVIHPNKQCTVKFKGKDNVWTFERKNVRTDIKKHAEK